MRIIDRHIVRELIPLTLVALGVATGVFFLDKLLWMAGLVLQNRLDLGMSWRLLCYTLPTVSGLTLPIGFLMGCTLTFHRMSADNELVVLRAAGISVYRLLVPFFMVAVAAYAVSAFALMYVSPWGYQGLQRLIFDIARDRAYYHLRPQAFNDAFKGLVFYVEHTDPQAQRFEGIFVADNRSQVPQVITAEQGELLVQPEALQVVLRLSKGIIHRYVPADARYQLVHFGQYDVVLDLDTRLARQSTGSAGVRELFPRPATGGKSLAGRLAAKMPGLCGCSGTNFSRCPLRASSSRALGPALGTAPDPFRPLGGVSAQHRRHLRVLHPAQRQRRAGRGSQAATRARGLAAEYVQWSGSRRCSCAATCTVRCVPGGQDAAGSRQWRRAGG